MKKSTKKILRGFLLWGFLFFLVLGGFLILWTTTINLPNLDSFEERRISQSTKIYDRTGKVILYDVFGEVKRTIVPLNEISDYLQKATIATEDQNFYEHNGIQFSAILRAIRNNLKNGDLLGGQGGSTITQQVIKNSLLTKEKKISRKLKEWILAPRLEKVLTKDQILEIYLNEAPYGGSIYGIQEAARRFFNKDAKDLNLIESAYLAALPQAPTYYSPYGNNLEQLNFRKNYVLDQMYESGYITKEQIEQAKKEKISFEKQEEFGIKAPHFVLYVREQLEKEYGREVVEEGGLKVITTLDWDLQKQAEVIVKDFALKNKEANNAENASVVAIDPRNGEILVMVGSRDYFDKEIDGNFNIATAERQPGSAFKPIVYAEAFNKGYRPETVVFDLSTEFSTTCENGGNCYRPKNYDEKYRGPMSLRDALAQSVNVPAIKVLYLAGIQDSLDLAKKMGIETLTNVKQYGLTLVLGGGEVTPLDMAGAYGVFAFDGIKQEKVSVLRIEDNNGEILFENQTRGERVLSEQTSRLISDVLSDNVARTPAFSSNSPLYFENRDVAVKTGTTNDYRDAWVVGYTPNISVAAWAGNNDNSPMQKKVANYIITPMWREIMDIILEKIDNESFINPEPITPGIKEIIAGYWKGEKTSVIDKNTGEEATNETSQEDKITVVTGDGNGIHSILHFVDKNNPLGSSPRNPGVDPQYWLWENPVRSWAGTQKISDDIQVTDLENYRQTKLEFLSPENNVSYYKDSNLVVTVNLTNGGQIKSGEIFVNSKKVGNLENVGNSVLFVPEELESIQEDNVLRAEVIDSFGNKYTSQINFKVF